MDLYNLIPRLIALAVVSYVQNMAFTWSSRSRNSGDPNYHRRAAYCSNGIWYLTNLANLSLIWEPLESGDWVTILLAMVVYVFSTTEGSVKMMKILLAREEGKHRVGAR